MAEVERATQSLIRFDSRAGRKIAPFTAVLLRAESAASSRIEHLTSSTKQIGLAELGLGMAPNARLVIANVRATEVALKSAVEIDDTAIIAIQRAFLESPRSTPAAGWRTEPAWIGGTGAGPHLADFVPPHPDSIPKAMADLVAFIARTDLPILPQIAVAHAHFETIHPFPDGNGRIGRALVQAMLKQKGISRQLTLPLSAGLLANTPLYVDALTRYRQGDPIPIVHAFNEAAESAVANSSELESDLLEIEERWHESLRGARRDSAIWRVLSVVMTSPVFDAASLSERLDVSLRTAYTAVEALQMRRLIWPVKATRRNQAWFSQEVLTALDAFAARARRA